MIVAGPITYIHDKQRSMCLWMTEGHLSDVSLHIRISDKRRKNNSFFLKFDGEGLSRFVDVVDIQKSLKLIRISLNKLVGSTSSLKTRLHSGKRSLVYYNVYFRGEAVLRPIETSLSRNTKRRPQENRKPNDDLVGPTSVFKVTTRIDKWFHASCNDITFHSVSALPKMRAQIEQANKVSDRNALCLMGDQIYADVLGENLQRIYELAIPMFLGGKTPTKWKKPEEKLWSREAYHAAYLLNFGHISRKLLDSGGRFIGTARELSRKLDRGSRRRQGEFAVRKSSATIAARAPLLADIFARVPVMMMWDDHEVDDDWNIDSKWQSKSTSKKREQMALWPLLSHEAPYALKPDSQAANAKKLIPRRNEVGNVTQFEPRVWRVFSEEKETVTTISIRRSRSNLAIGVNETTTPSGLLDSSKTLASQRLARNGPDRQTLVLNTQLIAPLTIADAQSIGRSDWWTRLVDREGLDIYRQSLVNMLEWLPNKVTLVSGDVHYGYQRVIDYYTDRVRKSIHTVSSSGVSNAPPWYIRRVLEFDNRRFGAAFTRLILWNKAGKNTYVDVIISGMPAVKNISDRQSLIRITLEELKTHVVRLQAVLSSITSPVGRITVQTELMTTEKAISMLKQPYDNGCVIQLHEMHATYSTRPNYAVVSGKRVKLVQAKS